MKHSYLAVSLLGLLLAGCSTSSDKVSQEKSDDPHQELFNDVFARVARHHSECSPSAAADFEKAASLRENNGESGGSLYASEAQASQALGLIRSYSFDKRKIYNEFMSQLSHDPRARGLDPTLESLTAQGLIFSKCQAVNLHDLFASLLASLKKFQASKSFKMGLAYASFKDLKTEALDAAELYALSTELGLFLSSPFVVPNKESNSRYLTLARDLKTRIEKLRSSSEPLVTESMLEDSMGLSLKKRYADLVGKIKIFVR